MLDNNLQPIKGPLEILAEMKEEKENKEQDENLDVSF